MANIIKLKSIENQDGILSVFEHLMPGHIERVYFIYGVPENKIRGGHRQLDSPGKCLLLKPTDWHQMFAFSEDSILLVMANQNYDPSDYIDLAYNPENVFDQIISSQYQQ
jgi:hypothetical protein